MENGVFVPKGGKASFSIENIMENGAFAPKGEKATFSIIFSKVFKT